jgi:hypothetical protein
MSQSPTRREDSSSPSEDQISPFELPAPDWSSPSTPPRPLSTKAKQEELAAEEEQEVGQDKPTAVDQQEPISEREPEDVVEPGDAEEEQADQEVEQEEVGQGDEPRSKVKISGPPGRILSVALLHESLERTSTTAPAFTLTSDDHLTIIPVRRWSATTIERLASPPDTRYHELADRILLQVPQCQNQIVSTP